MNDAEMQPVPQVNGRGPMTFELQRLPFWSPGLGFFVGIAGIFGIQFTGIAVQGARLGVSSSIVVQAFSVAVVCSLLLVGVLVYRRAVRVRPIPPIAFYDEYVELPGLEAFGVTRVPYRDILSTGARGRPPSSDLLIETRWSVHVFPLSAFVESSDLERASAEVSRRIVELPEGQALMEQAERRRVLATQALTIRPFVTQALVGILVVVYLNQALTGGDGAMLDGVRWGASVPALIWAGEAFRVISATVLHAGLFHIALNGLALYILGSLMERFLGWQRFLLLYLAAGLAGSGTSLLVGNAFSVGASGAVFGLLGGLAVLNFRYQSELPLGFRQPHRWWALILVISAASPLVPLVMPAILPQIDVAAHVGGFIAGVVLTLGLVPRRVPSHLAGPARPAISAAALGLVALYALGVAQAVIYAANFDDAKRREVLTILARSEGLDARVVNDIAWQLATAKDSGEAELVAAQQASRRAIELEPKEDALRDTLATALFRLGELDEAVEIERRIIEVPGDDSAIGTWLRRHVAVEDRFMPSQLARFLMARVSKSGPELVGAVVPDAVTMSLDVETNGPQVVLDATRAPTSGLVVYAVVTRDEERLGLLRAEVGPQPPGESRFDLTGKSAESPAGPRVGVSVALVDATSGGGVPPGDVRWKFWPNDPGVDKLP